VQQVLSSLNIPFANLAKLLSVDNDGGWPKRH
jgi:hypothetical protein